MRRAPSRRSMCQARGRITAASSRETAGKRRALAHRRLGPRPPTPSSSPRTARQRRQRHVRPLRPADPRGRPLAPRPHRHPRRLPRRQPRHLQPPRWSEQDQRHNRPDSLVERPYRWSRRWRDDTPIGTVVYGNERVIYLGNGEWQPLDGTPNGTVRPSRTSLTVAPMADFQRNGEEQQRT